MIEPALNLPADRLPRHIAIIMDGNGRWAVRQGRERVRGHEQGARTVKQLVTWCAELRQATGRPEYLTLYSFSLENWKRPAEEVGFLMRMYIDYLREELPTMMAHNVRFRQIGRLEQLPAAVVEQVSRTVEATRQNTGLNLVLALNYGGRAEITDAVRAIVRRVQQGELAERDIDEPTVAAHLYTADMPDPDLLIRTAGEMRLSNYLLWQISYAELYVSDVLWPDFGPPALATALHSFARRHRRFGALDQTNTLERRPE
jgi:undecaprenyl diphosphate synthase